MDDDKKAMDDDENKDQQVVANHLAKALIPYAETPGFVQYGTGGRECPLDTDLLIKQAEMLAAIINVLQSKNRRFSYAVAKRSIELVFQLKGFQLSKPMMKEAIDTIAQRLTTMVGHFFRAHNSGHSPRWIIEIQKHLILPKPGPGKSPKPGAVVTKRPASASSSSGGVSKKPAQQELSTKFVSDLVGDHSSDSESDSDFEDSDPTMGFNITMSQKSLFERMDHSSDDSYIVPANDVDDDGILVQPSTGFDDDDGIPVQPSTSFDDDDDIPVQPSTGFDNEMGAWYSNGWRKVYSKEPLQEVDGKVMATFKDRQYQIWELKPADIEDANKVLERIAPKTKSAKQKKNEVFFQKQSIVKEQEIIVTIKKTEVTKNNTTGKVIFLKVDGQQRLQVSELRAGTRSATVKMMCSIAQDVVDETVESDAKSLRVHRDAQLKAAGF